MLRAERTWRGRYLRVTRVTPLTFYPGAPQVHGGLGRAFARNYVRRNSLEYSGLHGEGSTSVPLPPPRAIYNPLIFLLKKILSRLRSPIQPPNWPKILLTGEIIEGDADTLKAAIKTANDAGKLVSGVRLNSPGGNLLESLKLADAVRFAKVATNVAGNATCASACFLVYAAGATKFANYTAQVGVHGASDKQGEETAVSSAATVSMARAAKDLGVPAAIIGRMVVTPPNEMVWLTPQDLQSMGTTMIGKPSQTPISPTATATADPLIVPKQTQPGDPTQLQPQTKSAAPPSWSEFLDKVIKRSAAQNNGKPGPPPIPPASAPLVREPVVNAEDAAHFKDVKPELTGLGGWLALIGFGQLAGILRFLVSIGEYYSKMDEQLFAKFPTTMWGEAVMNGALIWLFVYTTVLFFRRSRNFPRFFIFQFVATICTPIVALLWAAFTIALATGRPFVDLLSIDPKDGGQLIAALIGAVVWIPYIQKSRRVANTFTQ